MTEKQKELLMTMYHTISELAEECERDEVFHDVMIDNNELFPMSLDEWAFKWFNIVEKNEEEF